MTITYTKEHCSRSVPMEAEIHTKKLKSAVALTHCGKQSQVCLLQNTAMFSFSVATAYK